LGGADWETGSAGTASAVKALSSQVGGQVGGHDGV
jgi:hypothetical protein